MSWMFWKKKKKLEKICKNCKLFNPKNETCNIVILFEGERIHIPVDPQDTCFFDQNYFDPVDKKEKSILDEVKQVKFWVEDADGNKTDKNGIVKMQIPEDFYGNS